MKDQTSSSTSSSVKATVAAQQLMLGIENVCLVVMLTGAAGVLGAMGIRYTYKAVEKVADMITGEVKDKV